MDGTIQTGSENNWLLSKLMSHGRQALRPSPVPVFTGTAHQPLCVEQVSQKNHKPMQSDMAAETTFSATCFIFCPVTWP